MRGSHSWILSLVLLVLFSSRGKLDNGADVMHSVSISPHGGSHSPISWKKYPFLDIPEGGASAGESETQRESNQWGETGQRWETLQGAIFIWDQIICYYFYTVVAGVGDGCRNISHYQAWLNVRLSILQVLSTTVQPIDLTLVKFIAEEVQRYMRHIYL